MGKKKKIAGVPKRMYIQFDTIKSNGIVTVDNLVSDTVDASFKKEDYKYATDVPFYSLEEMERNMRLAFEAGWRMRMNRKAGECQELLDNYITLALLNE